jgi:glycerol-3-phosphate cytidylyltransferase
MALIDHSNISQETIITFGTFDVFHVGHLRILERARSMGSKLIVGVSSDELNFSKKGRNPVYTQEERVEIISALKYVDYVFLEESLEKKRDYIQKYSADILVMGNDWEGKFDEFNDICRVVYFERTPAISTTEVIEKIRV